MGSFMCRWNSLIVEFYVLLTVHPCTILQINPTRRTILINIFISLLCMLQATTCPSAGEFCCIYVTMVFVSLYCSPHEMLAGRSEHVVLQPASEQFVRAAVQSDKYHCRIDTAKFSWWWARGCPKHAEKRNKYIMQNCAPSWIYLQDRLIVLFNVLYVTHLLVL